MKLTYLLAIFSLSFIPLCIAKDDSMLACIDNYPPYQLTKLNNPVSYYSNPKWIGCTITNIIVPLYPKIYLEAGEAKKIAFTVIEQFRLIKNKDILVSIDQ